MPIPTLNKDGFMGFGDIAKKVADPLNLSSNLFGKNKTYAADPLAKDLKRLGRQGSQLAQGGIAELKKLSGDVEAAFSPRLAERIPY